MHPRSHRLGRAGRGTALVLASMLLAPALGAAPASARPSPPPAGTVVDWSPLDRDLWIPDTTARAFRLTYTTTDSFEEPAYSTGTVFLPHGEAPPGGWPVVSWAHGTTGLGDDCAPSRTGPPMRDRDWAYLGNWMRQGYAVVASDYVGLGTPGLMPYLDGRATAHSVTDMVKAGREFANTHMPPHQRLASKWVTIGQSQGAGASIYTARYATEFGGPELDYRAAVGTGTPAHIEKLLLSLGPKMPPVSPSPAITEYIAYIFAALRTVHPELGIDGILTPEGRTFLDMAETECAIPFEEKLQGVSPGDFFTRPVATLPDFEATVREYMGMPESGFDRPFFMAHGIADQDVPVAGTALYAGTLHVGGEPVTFRTYPTDHSATMLASLPDTIPFVRDQFRTP